MSEDAYTPWNANPEAPDASAPSGTSAPGGASVPGGAAPAAAETVPAEAAPTAGLNVDPPPSPFVLSIIAALKTVYDPEIPVDIFELGLIYKIDVDDDLCVKIDMTLTAPGCPVAGEMPIMVDNAVRSVEGVKDVDVNMVFDPPWTPERMSEEARVSLDMF